MQRFSRRRFALASVAVLALPRCRRTSATVVATLTLLTLATAFAVRDARATQGAADSAATGGQRFVPDVELAFNGLSKRPDALAFTRTFSRAGTICKHYQGIARVDADDGTPYLIMTKSGNAICPGLEDDEPGWLVVARLGSRAKHGERLRSNLLPYDAPFDDLPALNDDHVVKAFRFDGVDLPAYGHPGGMQVIGDALVVGADTPYDGERTSKLFFFDVSNPADPQLRSQFILDDAGTTFTADPVGLTAVRGEDGACCRYLLVAAGGEANKQVRFYRSLPDAGKTTTTLTSPDLDWEKVGQYSEGTIESCLGADWPTSGVIQGGQHQMLNLVREGGLDGPLYMIGGRRDGTIFTPDAFAGEYLDLYRVNVGADGTVDACPFTHVRSKEMSRDAWGNEGPVSTFSAASGVYVSPTGELIVYGARHDAVNDDRHILFGEYRMGSLVRADSPTLRPTAHVGGPFSVDEGSSLSLTGSGEQAITRAYVQLFEDDGAGTSLPGSANSDMWLNVEYDDRDADSFDDLVGLGGHANEIGENAGSWRWFAPVGCTISANDYPGHSDSWPGPDTVLLRGTGQFEVARDLEHVSAFHPADAAPWAVSPAPAGLELSYDDDVGGVTFFHPQTWGDTVARRQSCESYYGQQIRVAWDLDGDGGFEVTGPSVPFDATDLDGPSTKTATARAQHPTDGTPLGQSDPIAVPVEVRNVAPAIGSSSVVDSLGHDVTGGTGVAIAGLPVTLAVAFTDPGRADTQTARVDWGDGTTSTVFDSFSDAEGGITGTLRHRHAFVSAGSHTIVATVTDDDGGVATVAHTIEVLSLEDALEQVADALTERAAQTSDSRVRSALLAARDELIGNHAGQPPTNGAVDKLEQDDPVGAITKIRAATTQLLTAEAQGGGNLTSLKDLLGLVAEAIATGAKQEAIAAVGTPSASEAKALATIEALITTGHTQLASGQYVKACESFRQAAAKALALVP
jgi:hypothetical protein